MKAPTISIVMALLILVLSVGVMGPLPSSQGQDVQPAESGIYEESFATYAYRDTGTTADWDTVSGILQVPRKDGVEQREPALACDGVGNTIVVWRTRNAVYAHKYDTGGNPLWTEAVQVNSGGMIASGPTVAVDGAGNAVVVWHDERNGDWDVYAQKLSASGARLWTSDKLISIGNTTAPYYPVETAPTIVADGSAFFVAWHDYRGGWDIYAQRLDSNGSRLWPSDVRVNRDYLGYSRWPHASASGGRLTVVWTRNESDQVGAARYLYAQQLDRSGSHQWASDRLVNTQDNVSYYKHVAMHADGSSVVVWSNSDVTYMQRLSITGSRVWSTEVQPVSGDSSNLGVAALPNGNMVLVWLTEDDQIYAQQFDANANPVWADSLVVSGMSMNTAVYSPTGMAVDDLDRLSVAWIDNRTSDQDVYLQRFTPDRQILWKSDRRVNSAHGFVKQTGPGVAAGAGYRIVTWVDFRGSGDVYIQKVNDVGALLWSSSVRVNAVPGFVQDSGSSVSLASDGSSFVVWIDKRNGREDIYVQRIDPNGNRMWVSDVQVNAGTYLTPVQYPYIRVDPFGDVLVTWWGNRYTYVQKLDSSGQRLWSSDIPVHYHGGGDYGMAVDMAGNCIVVWWEYRYGNWPEPPDIFVQKIDPNGNLLWGAGGLQVNLNSDGWHLYPAVAVDTTNHIWIAWSDHHSTDGDIYLQRLDENGQHLWASDRLVSSDGTASRQEWPGIGIDGSNNAVIVWKDYRNDTGNYRKSDIVAQLVSPSGSSLWGSDVLVNAAGGDPGNPSLAASSGNISVVWVDLRDGDPNLYTQRLTHAGLRAWGADLNPVQPDHFYFSSCTAQSRQVDSSSSDIRQATLTASYALNGGSVQFYLTNNGGATWAEVTPGVTHVFATAGSDLRWRARLTGDPVWRNRAPTVNSLRIEYSTQIPYADDYEPDDTCAQARPIAVNGAVQAHTFHQNADADWVWFDVTAGITYVVQTANAQANADTVLELRSLCSQPPLAFDDNAFGHDARITWQSSFSGKVYVKVSHHTPSVYGADTGYDLSARTATSPPVVVIVGGHDDRYSLQANIDYMADLAYRTFTNAGVPKANVRYLSLNHDRDVDGNGLNDDIAGLPSPANMRDSIQDWARERGVSLGVPFYVYLVDHGYYDQFLAHGSGGKVWASDLNLWLSNLEATSGADHINVILEACHSGSFIDVTTLGPAAISGRNRVVIASTSSMLNAYPSLRGGFFSDVFWTAVGENRDLKTAFEQAKQAVQATGLSQQPWLDDNGDAVADGQDGMLARGRGLGGAFAGSPPVIDWAQVMPSPGGQSTIQALVRDDFGVRQVRVEVYPPDFVEPPPSQDGTTPVLNVPRVTLVQSAGDLYGATYSGFTQTGSYRLVVYAVDDEGNQALPVVVRIGYEAYLPVVMSGR